MNNISLYSKFYKTFKYKFICNNTGNYIIRNFSLLHCNLNNKKFDDLFPNSDKFLNRHIGPREQDETSMLDLIGFKVSFLNKMSHFIIDIRVQ